MKVNTDGILLGAIANVAHAERVLDLGTGSGLIAIMLAQRSVRNQAKIVAVELDEHAFHQATENAHQSPWAERIQVLQADACSPIFANQFHEKFDLIVSNPPYFEHSLASRNQQRDLARSVVGSHLLWLMQAKALLASHGKISFILPLEAGNKLIEQAKQAELFCVEQWFIQTKEGKPAKRTIVTFSLSEQPKIDKNLVIYQQDNRYTAEFMALTEAFYLRHAFNR